MWHLAVNTNNLPATINAPSAGTGNTTSAYKYLLPIPAILKLARSNTVTGATFTLLYDYGVWQDRFKSRHEAAYWMCLDLAFWCGKDRQVIKQIVESSQFHTFFYSRWHTRCSDGYLGDRIIKKACNDQPKVYTPTRNKTRDADRANRKATVGRFLTDRNYCITGNQVTNSITGNQAASCYITDIYGALINYCTDYRLEVPSLQMLSKCLNDREFEHQRINNSQSTTYFGIELP